MSESARCPRCKNNHIVRYKPEMWLDVHKCLTCNYHGNLDDFLVKHKPKGWRIA